MSPAIIQFWSNLFKPIYISIRLHYYFVYLLSKVFNFLVFLILRAVVRGFRYISEILIAILMLQQSKDRFCFDCSIFVTFRTD